MTKNNLQLFLGLLLLCVISCSRSLVSESNPESSAPGMKKISSSGKTFNLGTNDSSADVDEQPAMPVTFTYDYWIDTAEVSQAEYSSVMGVSPVPDTSVYGKGPAYPVYDLSWFDAALFCNAKSKRLGLDTVYAYYGAATAASGSVYDLVGLRINYDKNGIRLPTEAEWEFAAREASSEELFTSASDTSLASTCAWYFGDAGGATHPIAQKSANRLGLYDLYGNVFEWTADWKAPHITRAVTDPIGAQQHNQQFERVVKGGSFNFGINNLRPTCRSTTYPAAASAACYYVGFRCVKGVIQNPSYVSLDTAVSATNPADIVVSDMRPLLGTSSAKLVFVNVTREIRTLCLIDYGEAQPQIYEFKDKQDVYFPVVSPNGRYVAYCTQNVGFGDTSHIFIRNLDSLHSPLTRLSADFAYLPHWWVDIASGDTFLVYTNSSIDNGLAQWNTTTTVRQKMLGGSPVGGPTVVLSDGSFHDGISVNGRYAATGYTRLLMRDCGSGLQRQLFVSPLNGKDPLGSTQVCNVSLCPDSAFADRCMFLDFGATASTLTGEKYSVHQYIFTCDFSGAVVSWLKYPDGEHEWDFPKWSAFERFAVATARDAALQSHAIYLIDVTSNAANRIVAGISLEQPYLWIKDNAISPQGTGLDIDSLGLYDNPLVYTYQNETAAKMELFWKNYFDLEIIFTGSSQTTNGIDCDQFIGHKTLNMGYAAGGLLGLETIVRDYILPNCAKIKLIGYSATPYWLGLSGGDESWNAGIAQSKGYLYDLHHNFWKFGKPSGFDSLMTAATHYYPTPSCGMSLQPCAGWGSNLPGTAYGCSWTMSNPTVIANLDTLRGLIAQVAALRIHFLLVNFPENPGYKNTASYNISGLSKQTGDSLMRTFKSFEQLTPYFHFYDAFNDGYHDYADSEAFNTNHLCPQGAKKLSVRLDSLVEVLLR